MKCEMCGWGRLDIDASNTCITCTAGVCTPPPKRADGEVHGRECRKCGARYICTPDMERHVCEGGTRGKDSTTDQFPEAAIALGTRGTQAIALWLAGIQSRQSSRRLVDPAPVNQFLNVINPGSRYLMSAVRARGGMPAARRRIAARARRFGFLLKRERYGELESLDRSSLDLEPISVVQHGDRSSVMVRIFPFQMSRPASIRVFWLMLRDLARAWRALEAGTSEEKPWGAPWSRESLGLLAASIYSQGSDRPPTEQVVHDVFSGAGIDVSDSLLAGIRDQPEVNEPKQIAKWILRAGIVPDHYEFDDPSFEADA